MPRHPNPIPTYRFHKRSGQAVVTLRDPGGSRRDVYLGPYGSAESKTEYNRVVAEHQASIAAILGGASSDITVNEVLLAFWR
jgi:hypothetical protein